jgi:hypothetical protein
MREQAAPTTDPALSDPTLYALLLTNLATLFGALVNHWSPVPVLWIYWGQSVVIGILNLVRMWYWTGSRDIDPRDVSDEVNSDRSGRAAFFLLHYGGFHAFFFWFIFTSKLGPPMDSAQWLGVVTGILAFALVHLFSWWRNEGPGGRARERSLEFLMFYPYLRVAPMHFTLVVGSAMPEGLFALFFLLKTPVDVVMHLVERGLFRDVPSPEAPTPPGTT